MDRDRKPKRVIPEGRARAGDYIRTDWGELLQVTQVIGAGELIEAMTARAIREWKTTPNFNRDSIAAVCVMHSTDTSGREKRNIERRRLAVLKAKQEALRGI